MEKEAFQQKEVEQLDNHVEKEMILKPCRCLKGIKTKNYRIRTLGVIYVRKIGAPVIKSKSTKRFCLYIKRLANGRTFIYSSLK